MSIREKWFLQYKQVIVITNLCFSVIDASTSLRPQTTRASEEVKVFGSHAHSTGRPAPSQCSDM